MSRFKGRLAARDSRKSEPTKSDAPRYEIEPQQPEETDEEAEKVFVPFQYSTPEAEDVWLGLVSALRSMDELNLDYLVYRAWVRYKEACVLAKVLGTPAPATPDPKLLPRYKADEMGEFINMLLPCFSVQRPEICAVEFEQANRNYEGLFAAKSEKFDKLQERVTEQRNEAYNIIKRVLDL